MRMAPPNLDMCPFRLQHWGMKMWLTISDNALLSLEVANATSFLESLPDYFDAPAHLD